MSKFLITSSISSSIEEIIIHAKKSLVLVTPYLQLSKNLVERLQYTEKQGVKITLIYGKNELAKKQEKILYSLQNIEVYFCKNLHAKCYHNEEEMVITSMNLYEFSEKNNREMGLLIKNDNENFLDAVREIESIKNSSELIKAFYKSNNNLDDLIKLDSTHNEMWNFHFPSLFRVLKEKYPDYNISFNGEEININNFPFSGIDFNIYGRIDVKILNKGLYRKIEEKFKKVFLELPDRYYWNFDLNIYEEKSFTVDLNESGLLKKVNKNIEIIESFYNHIKPEEKKLKSGVMMY